MNVNNRCIARHAFLQQQGWAHAKIIPLKPDASFRLYFRLILNDQRCLLMDAPPPYENVQKFVHISNHLRSLKICCPEIYAAENKSGFLLLEDLGDDTFNRILSKAKNTQVTEKDLYNQALDLLILLQSNPRNTDISIAHYDFETTINEVLLLIDWYFPTQYGQKIRPRARQSFIQTWQDIYDHLPAIKTKLVLRDFHIDNLIQNKNNCAVIDYQDALIGSPAYDLASLLEDARRDINPQLVDSLIHRYCTSMPTINSATIRDHYVMWATQRHCKVAGIFVRLWARDQKPSYLKHLPRVIKLLNKHLDTPSLHPLRHWFELNMPYSEQHQICIDTDQLHFLFKQENKHKNT